MTDSLRAARLLGLALTLVVSACGMVDPERPTPQPDMNIYGNLMEATDATDGSGKVVVSIQIGIPRALSAAKAEEGKPTPTAGKGLLAEVTVGPDTVVLLGGLPVAVGDINPGTEVAALPMMGTTRMLGASKIEMEATHLMDFDTYRRWQLPELGGDTQEPEADPALINSPGIEHAPVPVGGGQALYFTARLRRPVDPGDPLIGARRPGLGDGADGQPPREQSFRAELGEEGWSVPELVTFDGIGEATSVRVTWVDAEETRCLVTIMTPGQPPWVGEAQRSSASRPWGEVRRLEILGEGYASDAVFLAGSATKVAFVSRWEAAPDTDLFLSNPADEQSEGAPRPLDPKINTPGNEWCPRVGPGNELLFCREDRQLLLAGGSLNNLRLSVPHRAVITEAAPTADGEWVFFSMPRLTPVEQDQDIFVARWIEPGRLGDAVPVDQWRP